MVKRGWEISGYSLSGLEMRWAAIWTVTQVSWQLWIMPLRAMDGFSGKDRGHNPLLFFRAARPYAQHVLFRHQDVAGLAIDLHVLAAKRPVPRSLDDSLGVRVGEHHRRLVVHLW